MQPCGLQPPPAGSKATRRDLDYSVRDIRTPQCADEHEVDGDAGLLGHDIACTSTHVQARVFRPHPDRMVFAIGVRRLERQEVLRLHIVANAHDRGRDLQWATQRLCVTP